MATVALGKYQLIAEIGRGGMADVFLAVAGDNTANFTKLVVIKKPREHLAHDTEFITMLVDEARIAARLNHPNLVQTLEVGEADGQRFLTMEYLDGQPLHRILHRARGEHAKFTRGMYLTVLADVLAGIHYAHELTDFDGTPLQIVHRDVTPHNVFVTYDGHVKVVDFGIAKAVGRTGETRHGVIKGKAPYMAPEQAAGAVVDRRVDIFAVGVMVYEAAVQRRMWKGLKEIDVLRNIISGQIPCSPKEIDPTIDDDLDRICRRALAASRDDRYPTAAAMQRDLEEYLGSHKLRATRSEIGAVVSECFAEMRTEISRVIGRQLARIRAEESAPISLATMTATPTGSSSEFDLRSGEVRLGDGRSGDVRSSGATPAPGTQSAVDTTVDSQEVDDDAMEEDATSLRSTRRSGWVLVAVAGVIVAIAAAGLVVLGLGPGTETSDVDPKAGKEQVTVTLRATPLETRFSIDDGPPLENPYIGTYPRDDREHRIRAIAPGYPPKEQTVVFSDDVSIRFTVSRR